jgi:hypothetical protein
MQLAPITGPASPYPPAAGPATCIGRPQTEADGMGRRHEALPIG